MAIAKFLMKLSQILRLEMDFVGNAENVGNSKKTELQGKSLALAIP